MVIPAGHLAIQTGEKGTEGINNNQWQGVDKIYSLRPLFSFDKYNFSPNAHTERLQNVFLVDNSQNLNVFFQYFPAVHAEILYFSFGSEPEVRQENP